ncbi:S-layer homology domain-containing protein [Ureibacillus manganicus]|uniref:S-layer homology domain-containing protein n=1 Tax=Ureibacillus manganicus TaxID=1266064 RepID=UPI00068FD2E2|nr:S-layer homology domain-containing protein [Ureibacillus manganicus]
MKKQTKKNLFNVAIAGAVVASSVVALAPAEAQAATPAFKDLKTDYVHYNDIMSLVDRGVLNGFPDGTFKAENSVTRADAAIFIANVLGLDTKNVTDPGFKDVEKSDYYYGAVAALANNKIISGYGNGTYGVKDTLKRGEMAVILQKAFELEGQAENLPFTDTKGNFYEKFISTLYKNGVTVGVSATKYGVNDPVKRGQLATFTVKGGAVTGEIVVDIKDGKLVTTKGTYDIDADLAKVFNADNAAALKGAKVKLEAVGTAFASANTVAATEKVKVAALTIVASGAAFDAKGYAIPNVKVNGSNVVVKNVVADKISVAAGLTVELTGVTAKEIALVGKTNLKLDATTKIDKIVIPAGQKVEDVISNYEEVKEAIKNIPVENDKGEEVKPENPTPTPGPSTPPPASIKSTVDQLISVGLDEYKTHLEGVVETTYTPGDDTIKFEVITDIAISDVRTKLEAIDDQSNKLTTILTNDKLTGIGAVYDNLKSISFDGVEYTVAEIIEAESDPTKKAVMVEALEDFVADNRDGATTILQLVGKETQITFNFKSYSSLTYKFKIVNEK